ncbi:MAG TPA: thermonuclease family protein [Candidatus Sericytochromatia bacterium]|jgi:micrococcal nuclease
MKVDLFNYRAIVKAVYDGDTCTVDIDLGMKVWIHGEKLRLCRINAPEIRGEQREAGLAAGEFLRKQIDGKQVFIETIKDSQEKYGRYLAEIWLENQNGQWININDLMVSQGHAVYKTY